MTITTIDSAELAKLRQAEEAAGVYVAFIAATLDHFGVSSMTLRRDNLGQLAGRGIVVEFKDDASITYRFGKALDASS